MKTYNLCLIGFGNIGRALARLLLVKRAELRDRYGIEWRITGVATRRMGWIADPCGLDVEGFLDGVYDYRPLSSPPTNVQEWLAAAQADVLFEISSLNVQTGQPAIAHLQAALEYGAHAITANKGPIVHAYRELEAQARFHGKRFLFEATVMGGSPTFSLFRETLPALTVLRVRGILNSTTNVILDEMEKGRSFDEGVKRAQELGIAETDPSADVDGWDAAVKVCAIAQVLMGRPLKLEEIKREGIRSLTGEGVRAARVEGKPWKLVCRAEVVEGRLQASVRPEQVTLNDPLASVQGTAMTVHFETDILEGLTITAANKNDPRATAYDMMADFIWAVRP
ncbi:MAG: homoserine dehydrogenase [Ktedonobacteraceae bacterium]